MAIVKNDPFPGTDYGSYQKWEKVALPSGEVFYVVPGNPAYVFDPVASNATGRKVFRRNPKEAIAEQQKQQQIQDEQIKQQQFNQSPVGQLLPVGASLGGLYLANQLASGGAPSLGGLFGGSQAGGAMAAQALPEVTALGGGASSAGLGSGSVAAGGSVPSAATGTLSSVGLPLAAATAAFLAGRSGLNMLEGKQKNWKDASLVDNAGRLALATGTFGLSEVANKFFGGRKSTRDVARDHTSDLMAAAEGDQSAVNYVQGIRQQYDAAPPDPSKPFFAGKYGSFDEYKTAGLNADDLSGVYGNISTYGAKEWANLTNDQRRAVTQKNIDAGNYTSKKGEVEFVDKDLAKKLKDEALGINVAPQVKGQAPTTVPGAIIDEAAKASLSTGPKWIIRNGKTVKVA
jgi:hypothetical protein